jgi:hypothetical protein
LWVKLAKALGAKHRLGEPTVNSHAREGVEKAETA